MQQYQRSEVQDWLNLFEQQNKAVSLRWSSKRRAITTSAWQTAMVVIARC